MARWDDEEHEGDLDISLPHARRAESVPNHLGLAIFSTVCCCVPAGIAAIVYAAQVNTHVSNADYDKAAYASRQALTWSIVSIILGFFGSIIVIAIQTAGEMQQGGF